METTLILPDLFHCVQNSEESDKKALFWAKIVKPFDDQDTAAKMEAETRLQALEPLWHEYRKLRITASNTHAFLSCGKISSNLLSRLKGLKIPEVPPIAYGKSNEPIAKRKFHNWLIATGHENVQVSDVGFKIDPDLTLIGASPDGLVTCTCHPPALLEIKCPYRLRDKIFKETKLEFFKFRPKSEPQSLLFHASYGRF